MRAIQLFRAEKVFEREKKKEGFSPTLTITSGGHPLFFQIHTSGSEISGDERHFSLLSSPLLSLSLSVSSTQKQKQKEEKRKEQAKTCLLLSYLKCDVTQNNIISIRKVKRARERERRSSRSDAQRSFMRNKTLRAGVYWSDVAAFRLEENKKNGRKVTSKNLTMILKKEKKLIFSLNFSLVFILIFICNSGFSDFLFGSKWVANILSSIKTL